MKKPERWFIYMLECENGSYYTGFTDDMARRYAEHRKGTIKSKFTRSFKPVRVARCWRLAGSRGTALKIERLIQGMDRKKKDVIVAGRAGLEDIVRESLGYDVVIEPYDFAPDGGVPDDERDITRYLAGEADRSVRNPYLEAVISLVDGHRGRADLARLMSEKKGDFVSRYAFSIPTIDVVREIVRYSPLVEIGAGSGYWAMCLVSAGADIIAYDKRPPGGEPPWEWHDGNRWFDDTWFQVHEGDESMAGRYPERTLFLCWPPLYDPMAASALCHYREVGGKTLIYVGGSGLTADDDFHRELRSQKMIRSVKLWSWPGTDERMMIFSIHRLSGRHGEASR
ncbi:MAG: hypothetical protein A2176_10515 [Spirochaetes bacterium RBG_13_51_14]|nr:MAG: hypothetical protein A2176_10515 [Spirochaetes bacterium RBG_13_51_14]